MAFSPSNFLSKSERAVFSLLPQGRGQLISSDKLVKRYYRGRVPKNGRVIVGGLVRSLTVKAEILREPYIVVKTPRRGPHPIEYGVKKR